jgi:hypothetical protein
MLRQAAIEVVQQARFECKECREASEPINVIVRFTLGDTKPCPEAEGFSSTPYAKDSYLQVTHSIDTITIADRPPGNV